MPSPLPIDAHVPEVIEAIRGHGCVVVVSPPGSGKTTRIPPALLDASGLLSPDHDRVLLLQPRRVAARAAAERIAEERGTSLGDEVGYQIRFERRYGPRTRLRVLTEGILTRQLLVDPGLDRVGCVVLDEFHERSIHVDVTLAMLREVRTTIRPDLRLVVMSATLDAERIASYLGDAPVVAVDVPTHPVEIRYGPPRDPRSNLEDQVARACEAIGEEGGDILVFLPGKGEISRAARRLAPIAERRDWLVLPLHGSLPIAEQRRVLQPADRRKLILSTNVAETSLTIDGVTEVVDTGLARFPEHDPARGLDRLALGKISQASAAQRTGRAGRTAPGRCTRLWAERDHRARPEFDTAEVHSTDLASTVLALHAWGYIEPAAFPWFDRPSVDRLAAADRLLHLLGALDEGRMTPLGAQVLELPLHPRMGRLLIDAASNGLLYEGATLAALLSERDIRRPAGEPRSKSVARDRGRSDLLARLEDLEHRAPDLDRHAVDAVLRIRDDLLRTMESLAIDAPLVPPDSSDDALLRLLLRSYPDRVCRRRAPGSDRARMVGGRGVRQAGESIPRDTELFLALDVRDDPRGSDLMNREALVTLASEIRPEWLEEELPAHLRAANTVRFDPGRGRAIADRTTHFADLLLRSETHGSVESEEAVRLLGEHVAGHALVFLRRDEAIGRWLDRLACAGRWLPDEEGWPDVSDSETLAIWLRRAVEEMGATSLEELKTPLLLATLQGILGYDLNRKLDRLIPESIAVPSGNRIRLDYPAGETPVLAVRLQEMFGLHETPRIGDGRIAVTLHLLGPNFRPVQITGDLRSFWTNTYAQVRKDLRNRYPRHAWPEDPWTAAPEAKGRRGR